MCLPDIFKEVHECFNNIEGRLKAEQFKQRVMSCFRAWEDWAIYPNDFLIRLQNIFLGLVPCPKGSTEDPSTEGEASPPLCPLVKEEPLDDVDGVPLVGVVAGDPDLDGLPLVLPPVGDDLDGVPLVNEELDGQPLEEDLEGRPKFVPSKWETVDPETVQQQAVTTSKWDLLDQAEEEEEEHPGEDIDGEPLVESSPRDDSQDSMPAVEMLKLETGEERRQKLREIELKVMKFQDELESGRRPRKPGLSISAQVEHYRQKLIKKDQEKSSGGLSSERRKERSKRSRSLSRSPSRSPIVSPLVVGRVTSVSGRTSSRSSPQPSLAEGRSRRSRSPRSPRSSRSHRSRSPKKKRSRSRSPRKSSSRRSRSRSPHRRRSSQSPSRKTHKSKKSKH